LRHLIHEASINLYRTCAYAQAKRLQMAEEGIGIRHHHEADASDLVVV